MSPDAIASVTTPGYVITAPTMPHLMSNTLDPVALSNDIEKQIRALIVQHRKVRTTNTKFIVNRSYDFYLLYPTSVFINLQCYFSIIRQNQLHKTTHYFSLAKPELFIFSVSSFCRDVDVMGYSDNTCPLVSKRHRFYEAS